MFRLPDRLSQRFVRKGFELDLAPLGADVTHVALSSPAPDCGPCRQPWLRQALTSPSLYIVDTSTGLVDTSVAAVGSNTLWADSELVPSGRFVRFWHTLLPVVGCKEADSCRNCV